ncbi:MAG: CADD family putative folate metabolism protein [Patescibacteria group bacterium]
MHSSFIQHLKNRVAERHLLLHPFYQHWNAGTLPLPVLQKYAEQYYHLEKNFPRFLSRVHADCEDASVRQVITENLYDEEYGPKNHRELWLRFGEALGNDRTAMQMSEPLPETAATIRAFDTLARESLESGIGALAAYESQMPDVAESKHAGLKKHYGITDTRGLEFFVLHSFLDKEHSESWWNILDERTNTAELRARTEEAVVGGRDALWNFLDGICRAYFPEALECTPAHAAV